jgi:hypothetical protein
MLTAIIVGGVGIDARHGTRYRLGVGPGIGRFEVYNVVQEHFVVVQFAAPLPLRAIHLTLQDMMPHILDRRSD